MVETRWLQSYSGVRAEVGLGPGVTVDDEQFAFRQAYCYALSRLQASPSSAARLVLARDPRPTGPALARAQAQGLISACRDLGVRLDLINLGVVSTPAWQHAVRLFEAHGGVMITASHNPLEDNGWKYATGVETNAVDPAPPGALLSAAEMASLIRAAGAFRPASLRSSEDRAPDAASRERVLQAYTTFVAAEYHAHAPARVVLDRTAARRAALPDRAFRALGVEPIVINGEAGRPACGSTLSPPDRTHQRAGPSGRSRPAEGALFGLAFDFDADRGSITYVDAAGVPHDPSPQAAAATNAAIALALHERSGDSRPAGVVASDATSCRVKQIAAAFGAEVVEVETGGINVVTAMRDLERRGRARSSASRAERRHGVRRHHLPRWHARGRRRAARVRRRGIARDCGPAACTGPHVGLGLCRVDRRAAASAFVTTRCDAPADWSTTAARLDRDFPRAFASGWRRPGSDSTSCTRTGAQLDPSGRWRPATDGKARLFRPGAEAFVWIRRSKTESGVARVVSDGPTAAGARAARTGPAPVDRGGPDG
jgi:phosphomannomutase